MNHFKILKRGYLFTISKIKVAAAILLHYTGPVFVTLYAAIFRRQKLTRNSTLALLGTLLGCYLVVGAYNLDLLALNRAGIIGGFLGGVLSPLQVLGGALVIASIILLQWKTENDV
jgi:drug/metabolite transporter (DMT)-like permease